MTKDRIIEILEDLQSYINREAVDVMNVNIKQVHAEALKQGIFELKKETVTRETYEWEYRIRKDLDNENAVLKERCKALEKIVEELKKGTTEKILIELPEDLYKSIMAHRSKTKFQESLDYQTLKNAIECGRKISDCEVQNNMILDSRGRR